MKRSAALIAFALVSGAAGTTALQADITPVNYPTPVTRGSSLSGTVTNIDLVNETIQLKDGMGMLQTIHADSAVQVFHNGAPVKLIDLTLGDIVTVSTATH